MYIFFVGIFIFNFYNMHKLLRLLLEKLDIGATLLLVTAMTLGSGTASYTLASSTSNFTQTINAGSLAVDIVDGSYESVTSPSVAMTSKTFGFSCQTSTGTLGTASEKIYIVNPDNGDDTWNVTLAASATTDVWNSAGTDFDFNDPTGSGCTDGTDDDSVGGQMTINPSAATLTPKSGCSNTGLSKGDSASFSDEVNSILLLGASESTGIDCYWDIKHGAKKQI